MNDTGKQESDRSIQDRSWDLLAEMWQSKEADEIIKEIEADKAAGRTAEMDAFFARYDAKNLQIIERNVKKKRRSISFTRRCRTLRGLLQSSLP